METSTNGARAAAESVEVLADLARGRMRSKLPALRRALVGNFKPHHALIVSHILAHLDYLDETITALTEEVEQRRFVRTSETPARLTGPVARRVAASLSADACVYLEEARPVGGVA